jgi:putative ABC transport system ATP-binding protein
VLDRREIRPAAAFLEIGGLRGRAHLPAVKRSGGGKQRVAIARAIVSEPEILIMDEPTASLDGDTGRSVVEFVHRNLLNENRCIVVVTHDDRISEFATRIEKMADGRLIHTEEARAA